MSALQGGSQPYELPRGWTWGHLIGDAADCLDDKRKPVNAKERANRGGNIPYYGATGQVGWIDDYLTDEELVLLGEDGAPFLDVEKNKAYLIEGKAWVNNHAHLLRSKYGHIGNLFLLYYLNCFDFTNYVSGSTRLKLTQGKMKQIPVPLPPLADQKRIVERIEALFAKLDAAEEKIRMALDGTELRRRGILELAFAGKLTGSGDTKLWSPKIIKECIDLLSGQDFARSKYNADGKGIPYITGASNFDHGHVLINRWTEHPSVIAQNGDVLLVCKGSGYGKCLIADFEKAHIARQIMALRPKGQISNRFLLYYLMSQVNYLHANGQGLIPGISRKVVLSMPIKVPPLDEQNKIVAKLDALFANEQRCEEVGNSVLSEIAMMKKSILAKAFRGAL